MVDKTVQITLPSSPPKFLGDKLLAPFSGGRGTDGFPLELYFSTALHRAAPCLHGHIDGQPVVVWARESENSGRYLAVYSDPQAKIERRRYLGRGNVIVNAFGRVRLAINLKGRPTLWASISKTVDDECLVSMGLQKKRLPEMRQRNSTSNTKNIPNPLSKEQT